MPIVTRQRACDAETPGVAVPRRKPDRGTTCPCSAITPMTLRGSRSRRCVRARRRGTANPRADRYIFRLHPPRASPPLRASFFARFGRRFPRLTARLPSPNEKTKKTGGRADDERVLHRVRHHAPRGVQDLPVHQLVTRRSGVLGSRETRAKAARGGGARELESLTKKKKKKKTSSRRVR